MDSEPLIPDSQLYTKKEKAYMITAFSVLLSANIIISILGIAIYDKLTKLLKAQSPSTQVPSSATSKRNTYIAMLVLGLLVGSMAIAAAAKPNAYSTVNATTVMLNITSFIMMVIVVAQGALVFKMYSTLVDQMSKDTKNLIDSTTTNMYDAVKGIYGSAIAFIAAILFIMFPTGKVLQTVASIIAKA